MTELTPQQIEEHRDFLQSIVERKRAEILDAVMREAPRLVMWLDHELKGLEGSAEGVGEFRERFPTPDPERTP